MTSKLYKELSMTEENDDRLLALIERRISLLEPLVKLLNHNSYYNLITEMCAELSEVHSARFELMYEPC